MSIPFSVVAESVTVPNNEMALEYLSAWVGSAAVGRRFWKRTEVGFTLFDRRLDGSFTPIKLILLEE